MVGTHLVIKQYCPILPSSCTSLSEEFKIICSPEVMMYRDSTDVKVVSAEITIKTRSKWQAHEAVSRAWHG